MKRSQWLRPLVLLFALALVAAACGNDDAAPAPPDDDEEVTDGNGDDDEPAGEPEPGPGFDGETIRLGVLTPTSGLVSIIGNPLTAGNRAYFERLNEEEGGIAGRYRVEFDVQDTAFDPTAALQVYPTVRDDVVLFLQILGTPVVEALLGDLEADNVVGSPASLDSKWVHDPNLIPIGTPYQIDALNAVDWWYGQEENQDDVLCTLASDDEYGDTGVEGVEFAAEQLGIEIAQQVTFPGPSPTRPDQTFSPEASQLQGAACDLIFFVGVASDTSALADTFSAARDAGYTPTIIGQSPSWLGVFAPNPYLQEHFLVAAQGSDWGDPDIPGMERLADALESWSELTEPDIYFVFGYNQAAAVHQVLEEAVRLGDLSRDGIKRAMESVGTLTFEGLSGDYQYGPPEERDPPRTSTVYAVDPEGPGFGLRALVTDYTADYAGEVEF